MTFISSHRYSSLVPPTTTVPQKPFMHSFMTQEEHSEVVQLYLKAAQLYPEQIDSDVQVLEVWLGLL